MDAAALSETIFYWGHGSQACDAIRVSHLREKVTQFKNTILWELKKKFGKR
jgi:hypothetical protein